jgi:hypothetical protein
MVIKPVRKIGKYEITRSPCEDQYEPNCKATHYDIWEGDNLVDSFVTESAGEIGEREFRDWFEINKERW